MQMGKTSRISVLSILKYYPSWVVAELNYDFSDYYRSLLPKSWKAQKPKYPAHVTVIRKGIEDVRIVPILDRSRIHIQYDVNVEFDGTYYYLNCWSDEISMIRIAHGLPEYRMNGCYHITIGNVKHES